MNEDGLAIERFHRPLLPTTRDVARVVFVRRWVIVTTFVLLVAALGLMGFWIPKYDAQMKILVRRNRPEALINSSASAQPELINDQVSPEEINSEIELLNSEDLLRKVVLTTGLAGPLPAGNDRANAEHVARAVRKLAKDLTIEPVRRSDVILVRYSSRSPELAENVLKALSAAFFAKHLEVRRASEELKFFDQQVNDYQKAVDQAQADLNNFTKSTGVVSAPIQRDDALKGANDFESKARDAQTSIRQTEERIGELKAQLATMQPRVRTVVRTADNPQLMEQLKATLLNLQLKKTELLTKFQPGYRLVQEVDQQILDTKTAIEAAENRPTHEEASDQNPTYLWAQSELAKAQSDLIGLKALAASSDAESIEYHTDAEILDQRQAQQAALERTAKADTDNYLLYLQKREEARINSALDLRGILNVVMAEQPVMPALPEKSGLKLVLLSLFLAAALSLTVGFVADFVDPTFHTPDELANYLGVPVLAALPKLSTLSRASA
jgi:uncharacterized protein involved in exopolysaccharide biosynthesis